MSSLHRSALLLVLAVAACSSKDRSPPPPMKQVPPALAKATQADLANEIADADRLGTWQEVRRRWQGQVLRWTVLRSAVLCRAADECHVSAFPIQRPAKHGWLPALQFAPGQFAALEAKCGDREPCELTIEGTLEKLDVSGEMPTNLRFSGVKIVDPAKTAQR